MTEILSPENPVFRAYAFWSAVLVLKVLAMAMLTSKTRGKKKAVANPEDLQFLKKEDRNVAPTLEDPDVERVRRAHLNDLENCLPFLIISFIYIFTNPSETVAVNVIRFSVVARIIHTYAYLNAMQPYRAYAFALCFLSMIFMSIQILLAFW